MLVPGKQNYSLAITWSLDYDPVRLCTIPSMAARMRSLKWPAVFESGSHGGEALPAELGAALLARRSLRMRKSQSLQDAVRLIYSFLG